MLDDFLGSLIYLYFRACFYRPDFEAMLRADREKLAEWNRGLARLMLCLGGLILLPLTLALLVFLVCFLAGVPGLFGVEVELGLALCLAAHVLAQIALLVLLVVLCLSRMEWEPQGFVLAAADLLGMSSCVLQNVWRALVCLPIVALILLFSLS